MVQTHLTLGAASLPTSAQTAFRDTDQEMRNVVLLKMDGMLGHKKFNLSQMLTTHTHTFSNSSRGL